MNTAQRPWITVVSGLPRSGTSMMMQMLAAGGMPVLADQLRAADEDNLKGYFEFEPVKRTSQDPSWLRDASGKAVKMVYLLLYDLPDKFQYRVIFMQRKMDEVLASQQAMLARSGQRGADMPLSQLAGVFDKQLQKIDDWLSARPHFRLLKVDYHRVLAEPPVEAQRICDYLGGGLDTQAMAAAVDPALRRQGRETAL